MPYLNTLTMRLFSFSPISFERCALEHRVGMSFRLASCLAMALAMVLMAGCSDDGSTSDAGNAATTEPTVEVVLGDSERGATDGIGPSARFQGVTAMCALTPERVALSDTFAGTIRLLDLQSSEVTTLAGNAGELGVVDGPLAQARFTSPRGIGCLPGGTALVVVDDGALRHIDRTSIFGRSVLSLSGSPVNGSVSCVASQRSIGPRSYV